MRSKTPTSKIKITAKQQLLGNYSLAIGSAVLMLVMLYAIISLVSGAITAFALGSRVGSQGVTTEQLDALMVNPHNELMLNILSYIVMAIVYPVISCISVGYMYICREISYGRKASTSDLFYVFKHHPDRIIIMSLILYALQMVLMLPSTIYEYKIVNVDSGGREFLIGVVTSIVGSVIFIILSMGLSQCYLIYLDDNEKGAVDCMKESLQMMKGNKWRYFYMQLSFIGYVLLMMVSLGIAGLWITPYMEMASVDFYRDLKGDLDDNGPVNAPVDEQIAVEL